YIVVSAVMSLAVAREGSYINYFLDLCAACSLAVGLCVAWARPQPRVAAAILLVLAAQAIRMSGPHALSDHLPARLNRATEYAHLASLVSGERGAVLADEPSALLALHGRTLDVQPFAMTQLARAGLWDPLPLVEQLHDQRFSLLLLRMPRRNPDV